MRRITGRLPPSSPDGHLYYVRLRTDKGIYYKLGFTKLASVEERLAYQGNGDEKLIDKTLLFVYRPDAFTVEDRLHSHFHEKSIFGRFGRRKDAPLYGNGQSELYAEDILGLDDEYTVKQRDDARGRARGKTGKQVALEDLFVKVVTKTILAILSPLIAVIGAIVWVHRRFFLNEKERTRARMKKALLGRQLQASENDIQTLIGELRVNRLG